jgi:hypothetical protein
MAAAEEVVEGVVKEGEEAVAEDLEAHPQHRHSHQML